MREKTFMNFVSRSVIVRVVINLFVAEPWQKLQMQTGMASATKSIKLQNRPLKLNPVASVESRYQEKSFPFLIQNGIPNVSLVQVVIVSLLEVV